MIDLFEESANTNAGIDNLNDSFLNHAPDSQRSGVSDPFSFCPNPLESGEFNFLESENGKSKNQHFLEDPFQQMISGPNAQHSQRNSELRANGCILPPTNQHAGNPDFGGNIEIETSESETNRNQNAGNLGGNDYESQDHSIETTMSLGHMFLLPNSPNQPLTSSQIHFKSGSNSTHSGNTRSRDNSMQPCDLQANERNAGFVSTDNVRQADSIFKKNSFSTRQVSEIERMPQHRRISEHSRIRARVSGGPRRRKKKIRKSMLLTEENYTHDFDYKKFINQELEKIGKIGFVLKNVFVIL